MRGIIFWTLALFACHPAAAAWHQASSAHFIVYADDDAEDVRRYAERLERFDRAVRLMRNIPDDPVSPGNRVTVYMVRNMDTIRQLSGSRSVAGFYIPRASGSVAFVPRRTESGPHVLSADAVLLHEYTHHIMLTHFAHTALPPWLVEGYAEFHATADLREDGSVQFGRPPLYRAWGLLTGNPLPVDRMLANEMRPRRDNEHDALYGRGWLLTHMLTFKPGRSGQLTDYIGRINAGETPRAASAAFGDMDALQDELNDYLHQRRIMSLTLQPAQLPIDAVTVTPLSTGAAAVMDARIRSTRGVNRETAPDVLRMAQRAAAPYPDDPVAQRVLAEAEFDMGNLDAAAAAADRAIAADPRMAEALIYRGMAAMAIARRDGATDAATWNAVRRWFLSANRIEPDHPMPLLLFFRSFTEQGITPTENAQMALLRAQELAPHDMGLKMQAAQVALRRDQLDQARALLRPVAYQPHGGDMAEFATRVLGVLDSEGPAAALALSRTEPSTGENEPTPGS
ncbi:tetratricopeptide (TPR) repeat protein [Sphingomonas jejuensis]|uniref:Tetratricopeptide (TPR) repeat protein n=1 Tax=Sphingomonas jejuensis TaxID=904715 RepID=A0ABX0XIE8_9SPHN|nr:hypothetical protein [Sphingomonas jejuensis]NJC33004.1 tetratricopeptide (TPR) repeat protein [Sphingomonas jejuensis]